MRFGLIFALLVLSACAGERLAMAPPQGVNFSGNWRLNEADSDDPMRVASSQTAGSSTDPTNSGGGQGGQGSRGSGRGGRSGPAGGVGAGAPLGPAMPGVTALSDGLRWPGRELEVNQSGGVVTITSGGATRIYRPEQGAARGKAGAQDTRARDRGDGPLAACGWDAKTLVVTSENTDDDHPAFEQRYSLSEDGQRLIEVVAFKGGRSAGFTVSRVWDRAQ